MTDYTIAIYCFIDDFLKITCPKEDSRRKNSNAEIITTALLAARYFHGNFVTARKYMHEYHGTKKLDKSNFNRHLHRLENRITQLFFILGQTLKELNIESRYLIDSFPISVCRNIRIPRCKLLKHKDYRGFNSSKREYFYGFKVQVITTYDGIPVEYFFTAGSFHDITAFKSMNINLPENSELVADSAYTDYEWEDLYLECENIQMLVDRKKNSKRPHCVAMQYLLKQWRKRIETTFSEIAAFFPSRIHAVTPKGFILKMILFLFAYTLKRVI